MEKTNYRRHGGDELSPEELLESVRARLRVECPGARAAVEQMYRERAWQRWWQLEAGDYDRGRLRRGLGAVDRAARDWREARAS